MKNDENKKVLEFLQKILKANCNKNYELSKVESEIESEIEYEIRWLKKPVEKDLWNRLVDLRTECIRQQRETEQMIDKLQDKIKKLKEACDE